MKLLLLGAAILLVLIDVRAKVPFEQLMILGCLAALVLIQGGKELLKQGATR